MISSDILATATIAQLIDKRAALTPSGVAIIEGQRYLTWEAYRHLSNELATTLVDCGLQRGERVGILLPDGCDVHVAFVACEKAGLIAVGISPRAGEKEIAHVLRTTEAVCLVCLSQYRESDTAALYKSLQQVGLPLRNLVQIMGQLGGRGSLRVDGVFIDAVGRSKEAWDQALSREELYFINTTSGTTGMPKCVAHTQQRWFYFSELVFDSAPLTEQDIFLCAVPASVGLGIWSGCFVPTLLGATTVVLPSFSVKEVLTAIDRHKVTVLAAVSTQFIMILNAEDLDSHDLSSLRFLYTGGERVPRDKALNFEQVTGATVLQFYGANEVGALSYTTVRDSQERRLTTAGRLVSGMKVRLIDPQGNEVVQPGRGQPICKGPLTSLGYFNNLQANHDIYTADGWMKVGDVVTVDEDGYLKVVGRVGDFIIRGGKNISAAGVEEAVSTHPRVKAVAAVAMPDPVFGERVCIFVTLVEGRQLTVPELADYLHKQGVSREYFPEKIVVLDQLPMASGGKVSKAELRERARSLSKE